MKARDVVAAVAAAGLLVILGAACLGLPAFGAGASALGDHYLAVAVAQRHATNVVMAVTFDYRGIDTLGEELILFSATSGVALLLRESRREAAAERPRDRQPVEALTGVGLALVPVLVVVGLWLVLHGHLTPGGGFQGGVVLAAGALMIHLANRYRAFRAATPEAVVDAAESVGVAGFVALGLAAVAVGLPFLTNVLPLGAPGALPSSGTILALSVLVGVAVAAAFVLLVTEFVEEEAVARA